MEEEVPAMRRGPCLLLINAAASEGGRGKIKIDPASNYLFTCTTVTRGLNGQNLGLFLPHHRTVHGAGRALEAPHNGPIGALASSLRRKVSIFADLRPICLPRVEKAS